MRPMQISELKPGEQAKVISFTQGHIAYRQKLMVMGLTKGALFVLSHIAPLGDPIQISLRGYTLSLRKHEAAILNIEKVSP